MKTTFLFIGILINVLLNAQSWDLTGNSNTSPPQQFLGTVDSHDLLFKTNNTEKLRISTTGRFIAQGILTTGVIYDKNLYFGGGSDNSTAVLNTVFGIGSLTLNASGGGNSSFGANAMGNITSGNSNVSIGAQSMFKPSVANANVSIGSNTMEGLGTYTENVAVGFMALRREFGLATDGVSYNTVLGTRALAYLKNGQNNIAIGSNSIRPIISGNDNVSIGSNTGQNLTSGNRNILIGSNTTVSSNNANDELNIGNWIYGKNGTIGIGTSNVNCSNCTGYKLFVKDGIRTEKIKVDFADVNGWADYVFEKDYNLMSLQDVKKFIAENKHLPEVPSAKEVVLNGVELKEMNVLLLKKVEELTLHIIKIDEKVQLQENKIKLLQENKIKL